MTARTTASTPSTARPEPRHRGEARSPRAERGRSRRRKRAGRFPTHRAEA